MPSGGRVAVWSLRTSEAAVVGHRTPKGWPLRITRSCGRNRPTETRFVDRGALGKGASYGQMQCDAVALLFQRFPKVNRGEAVGLPLVRSPRGQGRGKQ
jgi:hypothetical protein